MCSGVGTYLGVAGIGIVKAHLSLFFKGSERQPFIMSTNWKPPRRCDINQATPAELFIRAAITEVEMVGADPRLTDAVNLLDAAREAVADYIEGVRKRRAVKVVDGDEF